MKLFLEQTGQSWLLQPNREYVIGCGQACDILIPTNQLSEYHAKLSFNQITNTWYIYDLSNRSGVNINNQSVLEAPLQTQTRIQLSGGFSFVATLENTVPIPPPLSQPVSPQPDYSNQQTPQFPTTGGHFIQSRDDRELAQSGVISWPEFVDKQIRKKRGLWRLAMWFHMLTGIRDTIWVKAFGQTGFNAFDGYILPDFQHSAQQVSTKIEANLQQLKAYPETDCYVVNLTDAHIADSVTQQYFLGQGWQAIRRSIVHNRGDYRRFCVVSYHRVRTYLLVENYGPDLFVNWITRFEPDPSFFGFIGSFILCIILNIVGLAISASESASEFGDSGEITLFLLFLPWVIWGLIYWVLPASIKSANYVPNKNQSLLVIYIILCFFMLPFILILGLGQLVKKIEKQDSDIPPLDLVDAQKLDDTVAKQVEKVLKPLLQTEGYSEQQIEKVLTRISLGGPSFRR